MMCELSHPFNAMSPLLISDYLKQLDVVGKASFETLHITEAVKGVAR